MAEKSETVVEGRAGEGATGTGAPTPPPGPPAAEPGCEERSQDPELRFAAQVQKAEALEKNLAEAETRLRQTQAELGNATTRYRKLLLEHHPDIPPELIGGASIQEMDASLEKATALVEKIRESILRQGKVPSGAPARSGPDWSGLSPRDKIKAGLRVH